MNLEVSLPPGRSLVVWAKGTGSTKPPLGGERLGRDTTRNHISDIVELSVSGLALLLSVGRSNYSAIYKGLRMDLAEGCALLVPLLIGGWPDMVTKQLAN